MWGAIAGLTAGACLVAYEAAVGALLAGPLILHVSFSGVVGGVMGLFLASCREGKD